MESFCINFEGSGKICWSFVEPLLQRIFPHTHITTTCKAPDLIIKGHTISGCSKIVDKDTPYITWSGESYPVFPHLTEAPILELNTCVTGNPNEVWFPYLLVEIPHVTRPSTKPKRWCASYAYTYRVLEREKLFQSMRSREPTCYGFGASCWTTDNPFELPRANRTQNATSFRDFAFNVAMENTIAPRYLTEKIGYAFLSGSIPIYWGDRTAVEEFFNPASFINVLDFPSPDAAGEFAVQIWRDPHKLQRYLDAPIRINNNLADYEAVRSEYRPWQKPIVDILRDTFPDLS